jgi:hypothetical protein
MDVWVLVFWLVSVFVCLAYVIGYVTLRANKCTCKNRVYRAENRNFHFEACRRLGALLGYCTNKLALFGVPNFVAVAIAGGVFHVPMARISWLQVVISFIGVTIAFAAAAAAFWVEKGHLGPDVRTNSDPALWACLAGSLMPAIVFIFPPGVGWWVVLCVEAVILVVVGRRCYEGFARLTALAVSEVEPIHVKVCPHCLKGTEDKPAPVTQCDHAWYQGSNRVSRHGDQFNCLRNHCHFQTKDVVALRQHLEQHDEADIVREDGIKQVRADQNGRDQEVWILHGFVVDSRSGMARYDPELVANCAEELGRALSARRAVEYELAQCKEYRMEFAPKGLVDHSVGIERRISELEIMLPSEAVAQVA